MNAFWLNDLRKPQLNNNCLKNMFLTETSVQNLTVEGACVCVFVYVCNGMCMFCALIKTKQTNKTPVNESEESWKLPQAVAHQAQPEYFSFQRNTPHTSQMKLYPLVSAH